MSGEPTVVVLQDALPRYRRQFFEDLRTELGASGILLRLLHGGGNEDFALRDDLDAPEWAVQVPTLRWSVAGRQLAWQRCQRAVRGASLVIVEQASRHLVNYALLARQHLGGAPVAFWGHGKNFAIDHHSALGEAIKRRVSRLPHWWFVYTDEGVQIVTELGFPRERITVVRNSTDTAALAAQARKLSPEAVSAQRERLGLSGSNVGAYVGSLTVSKRLDFLIDAADAIRRRVPDFELLVLGGGECHPQVSEAVAARPWLHQLGPAHGNELVACVRIAKLLLVPAWAGLIVVDSFAFATPIVVSGSLPHPPEVAYIEHGQNGWVTDDEGDPVSYGAQVADLLLDDSRRATLVRGCELSCGTFSAAMMAQRFSDGIRAAVGSDHGTT